LSVEQVYAQLKEMKNSSIYDGKRLAQPDEVANYQTGDGLEKALFLANIIHARQPSENIEITIDAENVVLKGSRKYSFLSTKGLKKHIRISAAGDIRIVE
jgi:hypothetical protein